MIRFFILILFLQFALSQPFIASETGLQDAFQSGYLGSDQYAILKDWLVQKPDLCSILNQIQEIPGITDSDIDTLARICAANTFSITAISQGLFDKLSPYCSFPSEGGQIESEYRFSRTEPDSEFILKKCHQFKIRSKGANFSLQLQGKSDSWGSGYFTNNHILLFSKTLKSKIQLGSFQHHAGLGLTLGQVQNTPQKEPESFKASFLNPFSRNFFGLLYSVQWRKATAFIQASGGQYQEHFVTTSRAGGFSYKIGHNQAGVIISSYIPDQTNTFGLYANLLYPTVSMQLENSFNRTGNAFQIRGLKKTKLLDLGIDLWDYSNRYDNPLCKGLSLFGDHSGEYGWRNFIKLKHPLLDFQPEMCLIHSSLSRESKLILSLEERIHCQDLNTKQRLEYQLKPNDTLKILEVTAEHSIRLPANLKVNSFAKIRTDSAYYFKTTLIIAPFSFMTAHTSFSTSNYYNSIEVGDELKPYKAGYICMSGLFQHSRRSNKNRLGFTLSSSFIII